MRNIYVLFVLLFIMTGCWASVETVCSNKNDKKDLECYQSTLIKVYIDDSLPSDRKISIASDFSKWSIRTEERVRFDIMFVPLEDLKEDYTIENTFYVFNREPKDKQYDGFCRSQKGAVIDIRPNMSFYLFNAVALHEIGHALKLKHYEGQEPSIMQAHLQNGLDISCRDIKDFCSKWDCWLSC